MQEVRKETDDTVTLCFKQPGLKKIKYVPGQYLTLQFRIDGRRYIRPYSFSSAASVDSTLNVTVKRVPGGIVSNYINDTIQVNDVIEVHEPLGDFVFEADAALKSVVFWGVGSGITPLFSMIKELLVTDPLLTVYLVYGNKMNSSVIFAEELEVLKNRYSDRFKIWSFYSKEEFFDEGSYNLRGRIDESFVGHLMEHVELPSRHYICGPVGLKKTIKEKLEILKFPKENILTEDFVLVKDPKNFEIIENRVVTIRFQGEENEVDVKKGKSILDVALDSGIELPYSCQTGSCSSCKGKLKKGELKMIGLTKQREDLAEGEYLLCCSYPLTNDVYIEVEQS